MKPHETACQKRCGVKCGPCWRMHWNYQSGTHSCTRCGRLWHGAVANALRCSPLCVFPRQLLLQQGRSMEYDTVIVQDVGRAIPTVPYFGTLESPGCARCSKLIERFRVPFPFFRTAVCLQRGPSATLPHPDGVRPFGPSCRVLPGHAFHCCNVAACGLERSHRILHVRQPDAAVNSVRHCCGCQCVTAADVMAASVLLQLWPGGAVRPGTAHAPHKQFSAERAAGTP